MFRIDMDDRWSRRNAYERRRKCAEAKGGASSTKQPGTALCLIVGLDASEYKGDLLGPTTSGEIVARPDTVPHDHAA